MIQSTGQTGLRQVIGADESIATIEENAQSGSPGERGIDAGDQILFSEEPKVIGPFHEDLHQISSGFGSTMEQGLEEISPLSRKGVSQDLLCSK